MNMSPIYYKTSSLVSTVRNWMAQSAVALTMALLLSGCATTTKNPDDPKGVEQQYMDRLSNWLNDPLPPEARYSTRLFISQEIINQMLVGLRDAEIPLSTTTPTQFKIREVQTTFRDGFP